MVENQGRRPARDLKDDEPEQSNVADADQIALAAWSVMIISNAYLFDLMELRETQMEKGKSSQLIKTIGKKIDTLELLIELLMKGQDWLWGLIMKYYNQRQKTALKMLGLTTDTDKKIICIEISKKGHLTQRALYSVFGWKFPE